MVEAVVGDDQRRPPERLFGILWMLSEVRQPEISAAMRGFEAHSMPSLTA